MYSDPSGHNAKSPYDDTRPFGTGSILAVDLATYVSTIQFSDEIVYGKRGEYQGFGYMACGLVAGSYAGESTRNIGAVARKHGYTNEAGI